MLVFCFNLVQRHEQSCKIIIVIKVTTINIIIRNIITVIVIGILPVIIIIIIIIIITVIIKYYYGKLNSNWSWIDSNRANNNKSKVLYRIQKCHR